MKTRLVSSETVGLVQEFVSLRRLSSPPSRNWLPGLPYTHPWLTVGKSPDPMLPTVVSMSGFPDSRRTVHSQILFMFILDGVDRVHDDRGY